MSDSGEFAMFLAVAAAAVGLLFGPVGAALADRLRGRRDAETRAALDALATRLAEVEERLDFAERLLAQAEQPERLPGRADS